MCEKKVPIYTFKEGISKMKQRQCIRTRDVNIIMEKRIVKGEISVRFQRWFQH